MHEIGRCISEFYVSFFTDLIIFFILTLFLINLHNRDNKIGDNLIDEYNREEYFTTNVKAIKLYFSYVFDKLIILKIRNSLIVISLLKLIYKAKMISAERGHLELEMQ